MKIIGIDIGTTSICAVLVDTEKYEIIKSLTAKNTSFIKSENTYERIQNPEAIMSTVCGLLDEIGTDGVSAIGFSGQMHGIVYTDEKGKAVSPLYTWQDERAAMRSESGKTYAEEIGCFTGYGLATDYYNEKNGLVPENAEYLCTIADYAVTQLCSLKKPIIHITNAASLGCFDLKSNKFTAENPRLPEVTAEFKAAGHYKNIPVCVALGDNQASFIGSVSGENDALVNVGTGAQISWLTSDIIASDSVEIRPFDGKKYLAAGCSLCGGRAFAMLEKFIREAAEIVSGEKSESVYPQLNKLLETKTQTDLTADCRFCGTRKDPTVRGGIYGLSENNFTVGDFALSVLCGIASELYEMYKESGARVGGIVGSGNGIRKNSALQRIVSGMFECGMKIPYYEEEAAFGAALSSLVACGECENIQQASSKIRYRGDTDVL